MARDWLNIQWEDGIDVITTNLENLLVLFIKRIISDLSSQLYNTCISKQADLYEIVR